MLAGSVAVFAACAAGTTQDGPIAHAIDAGLDAVGIDVGGDARGETATPSTIDEATCETIAGKGGTYARHAYPGRSSADLARGRALICVSTWPGNGVSPSAEHCISQSLWVKDGEVIAWCSTEMPAGGRVKIVMPPPL